MDIFLSSHVSFWDHTKDLSSDSFWVPKQCYVCVCCTIQNIHVLKPDSVRLSKTSFSWVNTLIIGVPTFAFITQLRTQLPVLLPMTSKLRYEIQGTTTDIANMPSTSVLYNVLLLSFVRCQCKLLLREESLHLMSRIVIKNVLSSWLVICMHPL